MKFLKKNEGLTLVELMVSITIGSLIMLAASTVLLLGFRINHQTTESVTRQYTARTVITLLENLASEGGISKINSNQDGSWIAYGEENQAVLSYSAVEQQILTGSDATASPILENIVASYLTIKENILTISLEDYENTYSSSVYCRITPEKLGESPVDGIGDTIVGTDTNVIGTKTQKERFIKLLYSQIGTYGGIIDHNKEPKVDENKNFILDENGNLIVADSLSCGCGGFTFFSEWYVGKINYQGYTEAGWNSDTPWCACFVSWGLAKVGMVGGPNGRWYANVDEFKQYFVDEGTWIPKDENLMLNQIKTGDLIFFNMIDNDKANPSHMGVVLTVKENDQNKDCVYVLEGNSADMVAVREYPVEDSRIIGYGDPWA